VVLLHGGKEGVEGIEGQRGRRAAPASCAPGILEEGSWPAVCNLLPLEHSGRSGSGALERCREAGVGGHLDAGCRTHQR
jgi:hypothetical protein